MRGPANMDKLRAKDLRAVIEVAHSLNEIDGPTEFETAVLPLLGGLVPSDIAAFNLVMPASRVALRPAVDPPDSHFPNSNEILGAYAHQNPLISACPRRQETLKISDFLTRRELHRLEIYDLLYGPTSVEYQMAFTLPAPVGQVIGFAFNRGKPDFSERDRIVLDAVRPFVARAYEHVTAPLPRFSASELGLTRRQAEVLRCLAAGLSNAQIARDLTVSERTVGKHLENVYARLGVTNRTAAVARAFGGDRPQS
jgi:DNA-binding CsgD family transcriptional regulator